MPPVGVAVAALAVVKTVAVTMAVNFAVSKVSALLAPKPKQQATVVNPIEWSGGPDGERKWCYGVSSIQTPLHSGGAVKYWETTGTDNKYLWMVVALHDTPVDAILDFIVDGTSITFSSNQAQNVFKIGSTSYLSRWDKLGSESQTVETNLDGASTKWTSDHRGRGITYSVLKLEWSPQAFPQGLPAPIWVIRGRKIWDPRLDNSYGGSGSHTLGTESTYTYSNNAALCLLDYLLGVKINSKFIGGCRVPIARIDHASFAAAANVCDEDVDLDAGGTEKRYTINGFVSSMEDKEGCVQAMLKAMNGALSVRGGKLYLQAGAAITANTFPSSLTDDDLAGPLNVDTVISRQEKINTITSVYPSPYGTSAAVSAPVLAPSAYITADGGLSLSREEQHRFTTSVATVQRLNKLILGDAREQLAIDGVYKPKAIGISAGDTFQWYSASAGYSNQKMRCIRRERLENGLVRIQARQETDAKYSWSESTEEETPPSFNTNAYSTLPAVPSTITGLTATQNGVAVTITWDKSPDTYLAGYDVLLGPQGDVIGNATFYETERLATSYTTSKIPEGSYTVHVRGRDIYGQLGTADTYDIDVVATVGGAQLKSLQTIISDLSLTANQIFCLDIGDAGCYGGSGQIITDLSGNANTFHPGDNNSDTTNDPSFLGSAGSLAADTYFDFSGNDLIGITGGNPASIRDAHKSGSAWSFVCAFYNPPWVFGTSVDKTYYLLDTGGAVAIGGFHGIRVNIVVTDLDLSFYALDMEIHIMNAATVTAYHSHGIQPKDSHPAGGWNFVGGSITPSGTIYSLVNGEIKAGPELGWSTFSSTNASNALTFDHDADNDGTRLAALAMWNAAKTPDDLHAMYTLFKAHRPGFGIP